MYKLYNVQISKFISISLTFIISLWGNIKNLIFQLFEINMKISYYVDLAFDPFP